MLRALITPRWLGALLLALLFAAACVLLGRWQWAKYEDRRVKATAIATNYAAAPLPLGSVLASPSTPLPPEREWTRVTVDGRYAGNARLLVRNRVLQGTPGFEVLVPLEVGGRWLLVDRGWVPNASSAAALPAVPPAPDGPVTVSGWLRPGEESLGRDLPAGQLASISPAEAATRLGREVYAAYLVLDTERLPSGETPARPAPLERPTGDLGPHQAYAIQWWLFSVMGFAFVAFGIRTEVNAGREGAGLDPVAVSTRPKRTRIWDEEDG